MKSDTTPSVSIVTIFLNAERFLDQAMQNVPRQNFTDFARIVVDDGPDYLVKTRPDAECLL